jgi:viroplasmin and RNaseH domain-containing protein
MVVFTESDTRPLRSEITMDLKTKFELSISWEGSVEKIMKIFGSQDIQIGNQAFDKKYLIQSNNSSQTISVLRDLKDLILKLNIYIINLHYEKSGQHKLLITKDRNSNTIDEIIGLIELNFRLVDFLFPKK